jgi:hypothetical protein
MKVVSKVLVLLGVLTLIPGFASLADSPQHREITMWIASPVGSHLGSGYASTYLTNIRAKTIARENPRLREAIDLLDGLGMVQIRGLGLVPAAVAWQSQTSIHELVAEQAQTGLSYGELLMAHALASESKHDLNDVVAMRANTRTWGQLAEQLGVSPDVIILRANTASSKIRAADKKTRQRGPRDPSLQNTNPNLHHYSLLH